MIYIKVASSNYTFNYAGSYAIKVFELQSGPVINVREAVVKQLVINVNNPYDFGDVNAFSSRTIQFTIENPGDTDLKLNGNVTLSGADASQFRLVNQPAVTVASCANTTLRSTLPRPV